MEDHSITILYVERIRVFFLPTTSWLKGLSLREKSVWSNGQTMRQAGSRSKKFTPGLDPAYFWNFHPLWWNVLSLSLRREELFFFFFTERFILFLPRFWLEIRPLMVKSNILCSFRRAGVPRSRRGERNAVYVFYSGISTIRPGCLSVTGKRDKALTSRR